MAKIILPKTKTLIGKLPNTCATFPVTLGELEIGWTSELDGYEGFEVLRH